MTPISLPNHVSEATTLLLAGLRAGSGTDVLQDLCEAIFDIDPPAGMFCACVEVCNRGRVVLLLVLAPRKLVHDIDRSRRWAAGKYGDVPTVQILDGPSPRTYHLLTWHDPPPSLYGPDERDCHLVAIMIAIGHPSTH